MVKTSNVIESFTICFYILVTENTSDQNTSTPQLRAYERTKCILNCMYFTMLLYVVFNPGNLVPCGQWPQYKTDDKL